MVRHGATVLSAEDRFAGATDVALSDEGREQTRRLADRLSHEKIKAVYASPLGRTVETAASARLRTSDSGSSLSAGGHSSLRSASRASS